MPREPIKLVWSRSLGSWFFKVFKWEFSSGTHHYSDMRFLGVVILGQRFMWGSGGWLLSDDDANTKRRLHSCPYFIDDRDPCCRRPGDPAVGRTPFQADYCVYQCVCHDPQETR